MIRAGIHSSDLLAMEYGGGVGNCVGSCPYAAEKLRWHGHNMDLLTQVTLTTLVALPPGAFVSVGVGK